VLEATDAHVRAGTGKDAEVAISPVADRSPMPRRKIKLDCRPRMAALAAGRVHLAEAEPVMPNQTSTRARGCQPCPRWTHSESSCGRSSASRSQCGRRMRCSHASRPCSADSCQLRRTCSRPIRRSFRRLDYPGAKCRRVRVLFAATVMILPMTDDLVPRQGRDLWTGVWHSGSMATVLPRMRSDRDDRRLVQSALGREQAVIESSNADSLADVPRE
jgi:hypothetical protein